MAKIIRTPRQIPWQREWEIESNVSFDLASASPHLIYAAGILFLIPWTAGHKVYYWNEDTAEPAWEVYVELAATEWVGVQDFGTPIYEYGGELYLGGSESVTNHACVWTITGGVKTRVFTATSAMAYLANVCSFFTLGGWLYALQYQIWFGQAWSVSYWDGAAWVEPGFNLGAASDNWHMTEAVDGVIFDSLGYFEYTEGAPVPLHRHTLAGCSSAYSKALVGSTIWTAWSNKLYYLSTIAGGWTSITLPNSNFYGVAAISADELLLYGYAGSYRWRTYLYTISTGVLDPQDISDRVFPGGYPMYNGIISDPGNWVRLIVSGSATGVIQPRWPTIFRKDL